MLYLARVRQGDTGRGVHLLARQRAENAWQVVDEEEMVLPIAADAPWSQGMLLLLEVNASRQVSDIREATDWILSIVQSFLVNGITPAFLQQETERAEQWRQSLTLQNQELDRRTLELEARREQIQELEEQLKRDQDELEANRWQIQSLQDALKQEKDHLEAYRQKVNDLQTTLTEREIELAAALGDRSSVEG